MSKAREVNSKAILPVTLASIVRDEIMNPAGGVKRWLDATLPHVGSAVVVDTGSCDGTREILEEMQGQYPHLSVFDHKWNGFSDARNRSLREAKDGLLYAYGQKYVLVLDADEIIADPNGSIEGGYRNLADFMENSPYTSAYSFSFNHVGVPGESYRSSPEHKKRLFIKDNRIAYILEVFEILNLCLSDIEIGGVQIAHFLPSRKASEAKRYNWYDYSPGGEPLVNLSTFMTTSPSESARKYGWKEYNPRRDEFS